MNADELAQFIRRYGVAFPSFASWFSRLDSRKETLEQWAKMLESITIAECDAVLADMTGGRLGPFDPVDYGHFPVELRAAVLQRREAINAERERRKIREQAKPDGGWSAEVYGKNGKRWTMKAALAEITRRMDAGESHKEACYNVFDRKD